METAGHGIARVFVWIVVEVCVTVDVTVDVIVPSYSGLIAGGVGVC